MYARHLPGKTLLFQLRYSRRFCSFEGALQATSSLHQKEPSSANGPLVSSAMLNLRRSPRRFFASRSAADGYLLELLKSEIEQSKQKIQPQTLRYQGATAVGPFVMTDKAGTEEVVLSRSVGSEKIEIVCMLEKQYPEDEDEVEEQKLQHSCLHHYNKQKHVMHEEDLEIVVVLHMSVTLSRADVRLEVDCSFVHGASEVMIENILFHEPDASSSADGPEPYGGPIFEDLDEKLQQAFLELLKARGLSTKVARYMLEYMSDKEQREYAGWLHRLRNFLTT